ncbi:MAG TPA: hypothetical protein VKT73_08760 [Xanthobacteraceae bacterium]|nr:hypothetical protein [Xanthobacteraceae bacterium]
MFVTTNQFNEALRRLGLSVYASPAVLKVTLRQAQRYAAGEQPVEARVAAILNMLLDQVHGLKLRRRQLQMMIESIEEKNGVRMRQNNRDVTEAWRGQLKVWLDEVDDLLRNHPSGLPPQIN